MPPPIGVTPDFSGRRTELQDRTLVIFSVMTALSSIFIFLRVYTRAFLVKTFGLDDYKFCLRSSGSWHQLIVYSPDYTELVRMYCLVRRVRTYFPVWIRRTSLECPRIGSNSIREDAYRHLRNLRLDTRSYQILLAGSVSSHQPQ